MKARKAAACAGFCLLAANLSFASMIAKFNGTQVTTTNGNQVALWSNQGTGGDAQGLGDVTTYPTVSPVTMPNGTTHNVIGFDGSNDHLTLGSDAANYDGNAFTWTIVFKNGNTSQNGKALLASTYQYTSGTVTSGNNPVWQTFANSDNNIYVATRSSSGGFEGKNTGTGTSDEWHIMTGKWNGSSLYAYLDGSYLGSRGGATANPTGHVRTRIGSGSSGTANAFFNGQIAEIRIYNEVLNDTDRGAMEDELANTYMVPEPASLGLFALLGGGLLVVRRLRRRFTA